MTDQKRTRKPAGAAVAGAVQRPVNYEKTISLMVDQETYDAVGLAAARYGVPKADILREWISLGRKRSRTYRDPTTF